MNGFVVINPEVLIARQLELGGRSAPGLDFIRWRLAQLRLECIGEAVYWQIDARDVARSRAAQLAEIRRQNGGVSSRPKSAGSKCAESLGSGSDLQNRVIGGSR